VTPRPASAGPPPARRATEVRDLEGPRGRLRVHLTGGDGTGPDRAGIVVAVHGVGATGRQFRRLARALSHRGIGTVAPDRPGAGGSAPDAPGLHAQASAALAAAGALAGDGAVWVGHSWGAAVAVQAALMRPERVRGLVLLAPALVPTPLPLPLRLAVSTPGGWAVRSLLRVAGRPAVRHAMRSAYGPRADLVDEAAVAEELEGWSGQAFPAVAATARVMESELADLAPRVAALDPSLPVDVILGETDPLTAGRAREELRSLLPRARVAVLPDCGHVLHVTEAEEIAGRIAAVVPGRSRPPDAQADGRTPR
jgi:pimeloyl-ACP methyl ester carboxylesterase